jgi:hypothetical protein
MFRNSSTWGKTVRDIKEIRIEMAENSKLKNYLLLTGSENVVLLLVFQSGENKYLQSN